MQVTAALYSNFCLGQQAVTRDVRLPEVSWQGLIKKDTDTHNIHTPCLPQNWTVQLSRSVQLAFGYCEERYALNYFVRVIMPA